MSDETSGPTKKKTDSTDDTGAEREIVATVIAEMIDAVSTFRAPTGPGASWRWLRMCSDTCLLAMQTTYGATAATVALHAWVRGQRSFEVRMDHMHEAVISVAAAATMEWMRRAEVMEYEKSDAEDVWTHGGFRVRHCGPDPVPGESEPAFELRAAEWAAVRVRARYGPLADVFYAWSAKPAPAAGSGKEVRHGE